MTGKYVAIVIAAGLSSRMGAFKPLMDLGGKPAIVRLLDSIQIAGIRQVIIVVGHKKEAIFDEILYYVKDKTNKIWIETLDFTPNQACKTVDKTQFYVINRPSSIYDINANEANTTSKAANSAGETSISLVFNANFEDGMFSSVKIGLKAQIFDRTYDAALLFPVDIPLISSETISGMLYYWENRSEGSYRNFVIPVYQGKNGHPLLIPSVYFGEILNYSGRGGLKGIRDKYSQGMLRYITDDEGCILDMDTPDDYEVLLDYDKRQRP